MLNSRAGKALAALLAGALLPLGFAPFGLFPLPLLALAVLAALLYRTPPRNAFLYAWLFGVGQFGLGVSWIYISIYLYGDASLALSVAVMLLFVAILAAYFALAAAALARAAIHSAGWFFLAGFPAAWLFTEWVRSWLFTGFPRLNLGYSQIDGPLAGYAAVSGVYGVGWLAALSAGLLAWMLYAGRSGRLTGAAALLLFWSAGFALQHHDWTEAAGAPFTATLVQGNISQDLKWRSDQQQSTLETYVELTRQHLDSDLVIWPETAVPAYYDSIDVEFLEPLRRELQQHEVSLLTGVPVLDRRNWEFFNAVISLEQPGHFYFKEHLVPFGEYLPLRDWLAQVLSFLPLIAAGHPVGASICYEIAFGEQLIRSVPSAAYLVNVSNDAWFGDSLAPHQHLEMARMRARETGRYVLRATNTGVSAIIDADGRLLSRSELFETQTVTAAVEPRSGITPYVRWGNWPVVTGLVAVLLVAGIRGRKL